MNNLGGGRRRTCVWCPTSTPSASAGTGGTNCCCCRSILRLCPFIEIQQTFVSTKKGFRRLFVTYVQLSR